METWRIITFNDYETHYEISSLGRCRNTQKLHWKTQGILKPRKSRSGYLRYGIVVDDSGTIKDVYAHRAVAAAFIQPIQCEQVVNHKNGQKTTTE